MDVLLSSINSMLVDLPSPSGLSYMWGFGSLLGVYLGMQIVSGLFLALQYSGDVSISFLSVVHICRDVNDGWLVRVVHSNGASMFFLFLYWHIGRGVYFGSYRFKMVWTSGVTIFLLAMGTAFLGYVLPWGQMSFWAATVITNLLSAIPWVGVLLVEWIWGGFAVGNATLTRFFSFHFLFPFILVFLVVVHLVFLHESGSGNPLGVNSDYDSIVFFPFYLVKDLVGFIVALYLLMLVSLEYPYLLMDSENFIPANSLVTPVHIQPEWYFLFAYAILRSISSKMGGVLALVMSIFILYLFPFVFSPRLRGLGESVGGKIVFWLFVANWLLLTWAGACTVEYPFSELGKVFSTCYFSLLMLLMLLLLD